MELTSAIFKDAGAIPARYSCDQDNISPPLAWRDVPDGTKSRLRVIFNFQKDRLKCKLL